MARALPVVQDGPALDDAERDRGPCERALDELWPVARARLWTWRYLRETLRLWRRFHLRALTLGSVRIAVPPGQVPDCDACTEVCCAGDDAVVSLRFRDLARLVDAGLQGHVTHERPAPRLGDAERSWARREADASVFGRAFPVLTRDQTGTCTLLSSERTCNAWPRWPLSCARYPYALDLRSRVIFWAKGCRSTTVLPASEAPARVRALVRAVVDGYNERLKDAVLLEVARPELAALGLLRFIELSRLPRA
ncbi:MAG: hypothetical protein IT383_07065 [Deltaproteobacteria bacterium]|nr:hypothetical protein [Deltaproteobacteria bacterium]